MPWEKTAPRARITHGIALLFAAALPAAPLCAMQAGVPATSTSEAFGRHVAMLPNGNFVVVDPLFDDTVQNLRDDVGAVHLYRPDRTLIFTLVGVNENDRVGSGGVQVLANGNVVVMSPDYADGYGAVTWLDGENGLPLDEDAIFANVTAANSLIGDSIGDRVGSGGITALPNGAYVVGSPDLDNFGLQDIGASTWGAANGGTTGVVSATNSLMGMHADDRIGEFVLVLAGGNYVVMAEAWDNGLLADAGAVAWGSAISGVRGAVSSATALVGDTADARVGTYVVPLSNGHYLAASYFWNNGSVARVGAVTWGNGQTGTRGVVSPANSLVGRVADDAVGDKVLALGNGHAVALNSHWDDSGLVDRGAITWIDGTRPTTGVVTSANSIVGDASGDFDAARLVALSNNHYVVGLPRWDDLGLQNVGAVLWGDGGGVNSGTVRAMRSLSGVAAGDEVGRQVVALADGHFVSVAPKWKHAGVAVGAVTWSAGASRPAFRFVGENNSVRGIKADDFLNVDVVALSNGNYVVAAPRMDIGLTSDVGVVTLLPGTQLSAGALSLKPSLTGTLADDRVGDSVLALRNGHFVAVSPSCKLPANGDVAGAVTWRDGVTPVAATVLPQNSLVGSTHQDQVGSGGVLPLPGGDYIIGSPQWRHANAAVGAITYGKGNGGTVGGIGSAGNESVTGVLAGAGSELVFDADPLRRSLLVGQGEAGIASLLRLGQETETRVASAAPATGRTGEPVRVFVEVEGFSEAPNGSVRVQSLPGESCEAAVQPSGDPADGLSEASCTITFNTAGFRVLRAEFFGDEASAYSLSPGKLLSVVSGTVFADGFE